MHVIEKREPLALFLFDEYSTYGAVDSWGSQDSQALDSFTTGKLSIL